LYLIITCRQSRSTLFPYTTALPISLKRDACGKCRDVENASAFETRSAPNLARCYPRSFAFYLGNPFPRFWYEFNRLPAHVQCLADRKSTRLNSSHDQISYAVFCLKK